MEFEKPKICPCGCGLKVPDDRNWSYFYSKDHQDRYYSKIMEIKK
jgi:hypothetical protein